MTDKRDSDGTKEHQPKRKTAFMQIFILLTGVVILVGIGIVHTFPTQHSWLSLSSTAFSTARAMSHVVQIGSKPHPTGSAENSKVRQYLLDQLQDLGLKAEIQTAFIDIPRKNRVAQIHNVIVRIPGSSPGKALMLLAHYDSVPTGPGAADNGASVAAILETLRVLKAQPLMKNDLICLFTDGEEIGLLGAQVFVSQHSWAKGIGLVLNFEYRGNSGAFMMFETSPGNGKLIQGLAEAIPFVLTNSLMYEVYQYLPNNTDFTVFKQAGIAGMNFAAISGHNAYHQPLDRPELLNQATLQHEGDIMLALVKRFGNQALDDVVAENQIYFDFPGLGIIHYPKNLTIRLVVISVLVFAALGINFYQAKSIRVKQSLFALLAYLVLVVGLFIINSCIWHVIRVLDPEYHAFANYDVFKSDCYFGGFILLNLLISSAYYFCARKWLKSMELNLGVAATFLIISIVTVDNGANFLFTWPLIALMVLLVLARLSFIDNHSALQSTILLVFSMPSLLIFTPLLKNLYVGLTPSYMAIILIFLSLLLGLLFPMLAVIKTERNHLNLSIKNCETTN